MNAPLPLPKDPRHQRFADLHLAGQPLTDAYIAAGFKVKRQSAKSAAARLRKQPDVVAYIEAIQQQAADASCLTVLEIRHFLARIVRTGVDQLNPEEGTNADLVKTIATTDSEMSSSRRIEKLDPLKAIEIDLKLSGSDPELNHLKLIAEAIADLGESPIPSDNMPE